MNARFRRALPKHLGRIILRQVYDQSRPTMPQNIVLRGVIPASHFPADSVTVARVEVAPTAPAANFDTRPAAKHTELKQTMV